MTQRMSITLDDGAYSFISENYRTLGYPTMSRFILKMIEEYRTRYDAKHPSESKKEPVTDRERLIAVIEKLGKTREENHVKFQVISSLAPKDLDPPKKESEVERILNKLWDQVVEKNGYGVYANKAIPITWDDLQTFGQFWRLRIEKNKLVERIKALALRVPS